MSIRITSGMTDEAIVREIGSRFKSERLRQRTQQQEIEEQQNLSRSAVKSLESGKGNPTLKSLIAALRGIGKLDELDKILSSNTDIEIKPLQQPTIGTPNAFNTQMRMAEPSPMQQLMQAKKKPSRVRKPNFETKKNKSTKKEVDW